MNRTRTPAALTAAEEREWLVQERAWREERAGAAACDGATADSTTSDSATSASTAADGAVATAASANATVDTGSALASYRAVARALRTPIAPALPVDFARSIAAQCRLHAPPTVDSRLELLAQRSLLGLLAIAAVAAFAVYGGDWWRATATALPVLDDGTTLNWAVALAACLGLSWALDALRDRSPALS